MMFLESSEKKTEQDAGFLKIVQFFNFDLFWPDRNLSSVKSENESHKRI